MRIARGKLEWLIMLGSPTMLGLTPDKDALAMVEKGWLHFNKPKKLNGAVCITADGLRVLADAMDAGLVETALDRMKAYRALQAEKENA